MTRIGKESYRRLFQYHGVTYLREIIVVIEPSCWKSLDLMGFNDTKDSYLEWSCGHGIMDYCRPHENGCLYCLHCMKPYDYFFAANDFHDFEGCRKRYIKADREFEQHQGFPNVRFVQQSFTPCLPVLRYEKFNEYLAKPIVHIYIPKHSKVV
ncbi:hypothetical protein EAE96_004182 [Botrytis aclada]|nr:hypothetical protein EAE96_004182 [Botrytis aclada]